MYTQMSPADMSVHPAKVIWPIAFLLNSKHLFIWHLCWLSAGQPGVSAHEAYLKYNIQFYNDEHTLLVLK